MSNLMIRESIPNPLEDLQHILMLVCLGLVDETLYIIVTVSLAVLVHILPSMHILCIIMLLLLRFDQVHSDYVTCRRLDWRGMLAGFSVLMVCYFVGASGVFEVLAYGCTMVLAQCVINIKKRKNRMSKADGHSVNIRSI